MSIALGLRFCAEREGSDCNAVGYNKPTEQRYYSKERQAHLIDKLFW